MLPDIMRLTNERAGQSSLRSSVSLTQEEKKPKTKFERLIAYRKNEEKKARAELTRIKEARKSPMRISFN